MSGARRACTVCGVPVPSPFFNIILRKTCCVHTLSADALCGDQSACHSIIVTIYFPSVCLEVITETSFDVFKLCCCLRLIHRNCVLQWKGSNFKPSPSNRALKDEYKVDTRKCAAGCGFLDQVPALSRTRVSKLFLPAAADPGPFEVI